MPFIFIPLLVAVFGVTSSNAGLLGDVAAPVEFFELDVNYAHPDQIFKEFEEFVTKFKKEYKTLAEKEYRFQEFTKNHNKITKLNKLASQKGSESVYGINKFADRSEQEFYDSVSKLPPKHHEDVEEFDLFGHKKSNSSRTKRSADKLPKSFDLRTKKVAGKYVVGPVKDQGTCGCCWAFATTAVMESAFAIHQKKFTSLSDQEICDCHLTSTPGCTGGDYAEGMKHVLAAGLSSASDYPYEDGRSNFTGRCDAAKYERKMQPRGIRFFKMPKFNAEPEIMESLFYVNTPVDVAFRIGRGFQFYDKDVLEMEDCLLEKEQHWHSNAIIGYGTQLNSKGRLVDYWILKNSWGTDWGESGFVRIARGVNWCQIESHAMSADMRPLAYYKQFKH